MKQNVSSEGLFSRFLTLLALARPQWRLLLLGTVLLFICTAMTLLYPQLFRIIFDEAIAKQEVVIIDQMIVLLMASFVVYAVAGGFRYWLFGFAGEKVVADLRERLFQHIMIQEIGFFDQQKSGELLSRLSADTALLEDAVSQHLAFLLRHVTIGMGGIGLILYISIPLTLLMLAVIPPAIWVASRSGRVIRNYSSQTQQALADATSVAEETIAGIRTVRSYVREPAEVRRYGAAIRNFLSFAKRRIFVIASLEGIVVVVSSAGVVAVLWYGSRMVAGGVLSLGELTSFLLYTYLINSSVSGLTNLWAEFTSAVGAMDRVFDILNRAPKMPMSGGISKHSLSGDVKFENVSFAYPARSQSMVFNNLNLTIQAGECLALVGPSGGGKSTIVNLLARFYEPSGGRIVIDGHDIHDYDPSWFRQQIGIVEQTPTLFSSSIGSNIRLGRADATQEETGNAARAANVHDLIMTLPKTYATEVGDRGMQLSGGQKQRIAIARAILKDPSILILDEATSALDTENESLVSEALAHLMVGRTTLIIAHRLSTIMTANRVLVIDEGRVVQSGRHQELLMDKEGLYHRLVEQQFKF